MFEKRRLEKKSKFESREKVKKIKIFLEKVERHWLLEKRPKKVLEQ